MATKTTRVKSGGGSKTPVDVTIRRSNLASGGTEVLYGSVNCKKMTVRALLDAATSSAHGALNKEVLSYAAEELSRLMMDKLRQGYAVELLDFGTIYPAMRGSIRATDTPSQLKAHFDVGFTPSKQARAAVGALVVRSVRPVQRQHCIYTVSDVFGGTENGTLICGGVGRIIGKALKLGGGTCGLYAARVDANWNGSLPAHDCWIRLEHVITNLPSRLEFMTELSAGNYVFVVETSLSAGGKSLKQHVTVTSDVVHVSDAGAA